MSTLTGILMASNRDRDPEERRRDRRRIRRPARVLLVEERVELGVELGLAAVGGGCRVRVHRRAVVVPELGEILRGGARELEHVGVALAGDLLLGHARADEALDDVGLDAPRHRADEPLGRWRRVGRADPENLRNQGGVARDPVAHHDPATEPSDTNDLLGYVLGPGREHRAEDADDEVEAVVVELVQVGGVALLEPEVRQTEGLRALVARRHEVARDVDAEDVRPELSLGDGGRPVTAADVEHVEPGLDVQLRHELLTAVAHVCRESGEVALLPERLVRIHRRGRLVRRRHGLPPRRIGSGCVATLSASGQPVHGTCSMVGTQWANRSNGASSSGHFGKERSARTTASRTFTWRQATATRATSPGRAMHRARATWSSATRTTSGRHTMSFPPAPSRESAPMSEPCGSLLAAARSRSYPEHHDPPAPVESWMADAI